MSEDEARTFLASHRWVFIIGAPRSGTTWLQTMLGQINGLATHVELSLFHRYLPQLWRIWEDESAVNNSRKWSIGQPTLWSEKQFEGWTCRLIAETYQTMLGGKSASIILDKHPGYTFHVELTKRYLPGAHFIHLIRDGRDVARS